MTPELEPILAEIRAVMRKHDVMGAVIISNPTHADFQMHLDASWSCATTSVDPINPEEVAVRIRAKVAEFPSPEAHRACLTHTVGSIVAAYRASAIMTKNFEVLLDRIEKTLAVERGPGFVRPNHRGN